MLSLNGKYHDSVILRAAAASGKRKDLLTVFRGDTGFVQRMLQSIIDLDIVFSLCFGVKKVVPLIG